MLLLLLLLLPPMYRTQVRPKKYNDTFKSLARLTFHMSSLRFSSFTPSYMDDTPSSTVTPIRFRDDLFFFYPAAAIR